ncbi:MAG: hypothetical protein ACHP7O_00965 [Burkholderiales bacterium]
MNTRSKTGKPRSNLTRALICAVLGGLAFGFVPGFSQAEEDQDAGALLLADKTPDAVAQASDWRTYIEGAYGGYTQRDGNPAQQNHRLSFDVQYDNSFAPGWRALFGDRLDIAWPPQIIDQNSIDQKSINTIKDAYLSWQTQSNTIFDVGRINVHEGVATGYNPTDYFRNGAVRSIVSADPASLKENRQGSVMLRGQTLWDSGSVTALVSPKLSVQQNNSGFNPDWSATNNQNRWLLAVSQKVSDNINPQFLIYQEAKLPTQLGFNLTGLLNDATIAYVEWSGGNSPSQLTQALSQQGFPHANDSAFRNRLSSGLTYTTSNKISLTAELEYDGGGMDQSDWNALYRQSPLKYEIYREWLLVVRELPTRQTVFLHAGWQDAMIIHLDLSAMEYADMVDYSRMSWLEARYHLTHAEFALQWQRFSGKPLSDYGISPQSQSWQAVLRYYF